MNDISLLQLFSIRDLYTKYFTFIKEHNVNREVFQIIQDLEEYYHENPDLQTINWEIVSTWFKIVRHPSFKEDVIFLYNNIFESLVKGAASTIESTLINSFVTRDFLTRIADVSLKGAEGNTEVSISVVEDLVNEYKKTMNQTSKVEDFLVEENLDSLLEHVVSGGGLNWRLKELNLGLGPLRKGDFICVTARPDSGKTTFLASEASFMAKQIPNYTHILWFNNEEEGRKVKLRIVQAALGWTYQEILNSPKKAWDLYKQEVGELNRILVYDRPSFSCREVTEVLKKYTPSLIIFDQLRKVKGFEYEGGNDVGRLQLLFQQAREWAKEFAPVINVHQARGDAEGQRWIELNQIHGSQTDIAGEVDAMIALGRTHDPGFESSRFLYLPKNKLVGGPLSEEKYKNGKFEITFKPSIAR